MRYNLLVKLCQKERVSGATIHNESRRSGMLREVIANAKPVQLSRVNTARPRSCGLFQPT